MTNSIHAGQPYETAVIGANFAGLSAALYLLRARRRVVLFDDGRNRNRFTDQSHGFLGHDGMDPASIKANALAQLHHYPTLTMVEARVTTVSGEVEDFHLEWAGGSARARRLVLATGLRDLLPDVPGLADCWGLTANSCPYCHGYELADLPTGILLDDRPHAGHYLRQISRWAGQLTVLDNGATLGPEILALIAERGVAHLSGPIQGLEHDLGILRAVRVGDRALPLRALYLGTRTEHSAPFAATLGCAVSDGPTGPFVTVDQWQRSSVPGVYAAGDLARPMHAAIFAAAAGATAGLACDMDLAGLLPD